MVLLRCWNRGVVVRVESKEQTGGQTWLAQWGGWCGGSIVGFDERVQKQTPETTHLCVCLPCCGV